MTTPTETVTTAEELDALPVHSVLLAHWPDGRQEDHRVVRSGGHFGAGASGWTIANEREWGRLLTWGATLTVAHRPDAPAGANPEALAGVRATPSLLTSLAETLDGYESPSDIDAGAARDAVRDLADALAAAVTLLATRPSRPSVTAEQRLALARVFAGARSGPGHVAFYERQGADSPLWLQALGEADAALAALGLTVQP